ncbi:hypothetical protein [Kitasatospora sp. NPDC047058]|uniref:hypothetical protein n=1 Tax=Kitasatospora sp. NPDC047058 TaxID=3155620 RepID=UPI0034056B3F
MTRAGLLDPLLLLGADQQHIVTRAQLRRLGVPPGTIAHRLRPGGPWQQVLPRVICLQNGRLTAHQRLRAALAFAGPKGRAPQAGEVLLTGVAVLAGAGLPSAGHPADLSEVDVLIPGRRRVADREFVRVHRACGAMPGGFERDDGLWSATVARALEIDSRAWHLRPADHERSLARADRFTAAGLPVVRTTPVQLRRDPAPVLRELTTLLTAGPHTPHTRISWRRAR